MYTLPLLPKPKGNKYKEVKIKSSQLLMTEQ